MVLTVRQWRAVRGKTQAEMSELLGVHINTYRNWEKTPHIIDVRHAQRLAEIFEADINDIDFTKGAR